MQEITIVELEKIAEFPPVQNLIRVLLKKGYKTNFIGAVVSDISEEIKSDLLFNSIEKSLF